MTVTLWNVTLAVEHWMTGNRMTTLGWSMRTGSHIVLTLFKSKDPNLWRMLSEITESWWERWVNSLQWRHDRYGVSYHRQLDFFTTAWSTKTTPKLHYWTLWGESTDERIPLTKGQLCGKLFHVMASAWYICYDLTPDSGQIREPKYKISFGFNHYILWCIISQNWNDSVVT